MELNKLYNMDCMEGMKQLPNNFVDSIVTDPPAGISFMGKKWDDDKGGRDKWIKWLSSIFIEAKRVLKPGGHALVWALPRTSHWTAMSLEDAGFEVRDCVYHVFGSGFPKSLDISKSIDKYFGEKREPILDKEGNQVWTSQKQGKKSIFDGGKERPATYPATYWSGWGTGLKPAVECWWLVRKPMEEKTVAENILKYGTGGINIDGCRVAGISEQDKNNFHQNRKVVKEYTADETLYELGMKTVSTAEHSLGRFPANFIHDGSEEVISLFPYTESGKMEQKIKGGNFNVYKKQYPREVETIGDSGSASRFFYCAKPSVSERNERIEGMEERESVYPGINSFDENGNRLRKDGSIIPPLKSKNFHPTVKPQELMKYLIKLITQKEGIVMDIFAGSGSTLVAAKYSGFKFIGFEIDKEYCEIANKRLSQNTL